MSFNIYASIFKQLRTLWIYISITLEIPLMSISINFLKSLWGNYNSTGLANIIIDIMVTVGERCWDKTMDIFKFY